MQDSVTKRFAVRVYESVLGDVLGDALHPGGLKLTARAAEVAKIDRNSRVLDIACGKGTTAYFLWEQYGCQVVGIELSVKLLSVARGKAKELSGELDLVMGDAENLPFRDSVFDVVMSECSFSLLPNKEMTAMEFKRVLRPGGRVTITDVILRGQISEELQSRAPFACCITGAKRLEEYIELAQGIGFTAPYVEDHSKELRKIGYQVLIGCGSIESFSAMLSDKPGAAESIKDWQRVFKEGKAGYALIAMAKP